MVTINVLLNDTDVDLPHDELAIVEIVTDPAHGTAEIIDGQIKYTHDGFVNLPDSLTYRIEDQAGHSATATVAIAVDQANSGPTDITLSNNTIGEDADTISGPAFIGLLDAVDPNDGEVFTFDLVAGSGDADNADFEISGNELRFKQGVVLEHASKNQYTLRIRVTDHGGLSTQKMFTVYVNRVVIIDNGDPGFDFSEGNWKSLRFDAYDDDIAYNRGVGGLPEKATWTFTGLDEGQYHVSATWKAQSNLATNVPYFIYDGTTSDALIATATIDQKAGPGNFEAGGFDWQVLNAEVYVLSGTLTVEVDTTTANNSVFADAVRIEHLPILGPEVKVEFEGANIADDFGHADFGRVLPGTGATKTFTVRNLGIETLELGALSIPAGFSLASALGSTLLAPAGSPGSSTTFQLHFSADDSASGEVSFGTNDSNENPFNFQVSGVAGGIVRILDNGDPGFDFPVGNWRTINFNSYDGDIAYNRGVGGLPETATWTFSDLEEGLYQVSSTWKPQSNLATNVQYSIYAGTTSGELLDEATIDQKAGPGNFEDGGFDWQLVGGLVYINSGSLTVEVDTTTANNSVFADAIRIEQFPIPGPEIKVEVDGASVIDDVGEVDFGRTLYGTSLTKTFTVRNLGSETLTLGTLSAPTGFSVASGFGSPTLAPAGFPGSSTTFQIRFDAANAASGEVSFGTNDSNENPFNFQVSGHAGGIVQIIDNGDAGFAFPVGNWKTISFDAYDGDIAYNRYPGTLPETATWTFSGLDEGFYQVSATWKPQSNLATNAPYALYDGTTSGSLLDVATIDQKAGPDDIEDAGFNWELVGGLAYVTSGTLTVEVDTLTADASVFADAVRIERIIPLSPPPSSLLAANPGSLVALRTEEAIDSLLRPRTRISAEGVDRLFGAVPRAADPLAAEQPELQLGAAPGRADAEVAVRRYLTHTHAGRKIEPWANRRLDHVRDDHREEQAVDTVFAELGQPLKSTD